MLIQKFEEVLATYRPSSNRAMLRDIFFRRFLERGFMTLQQIGDRHGISEAAIKQNQKVLLGKLRNTILSDERFLDYWE